MKNIKILLGLVITIVFTFTILNTYAEVSRDEQVICAQDVKECSNGLYVSRTGLNCEFVCPSDGGTSIPKTCISWYDGCNTCGVKDGKLTMCTEMACFTQNEPKCLEYSEIKKPVACTKDAKICSDGSSVSRIGSNCEFPACPGDSLTSDNPEVCTQEAKKCSDGSYVSRSEANCEFALCPVVKALSNRLKIKADSISEIFIKKLENKYGDNVRRVTILNIIILKLEKLSEEKPRFKSLVEYLNYKLEEKREYYSEK